MPAKHPRAWTVWERRGDRWRRWFTFYGKYREEAADLATHTSDAGYVATWCRILPAGQRPGRAKKAKVAK